MNSTNDTEGHLRLFQWVEYLHPYETEKYIFGDFFNFLWLSELFKGSCEVYLCLVVVCDGLKTPNRHTQKNAHVGFLDIAALHGSP